MATMNRNINLEEINSDAFLGIPFLNHQTIIQKVEFWGGIIIAVIWNILGNFVFHLNPLVIVIFTLVPILIGSIFGCNYNQDLSLIKYLYLILNKPATVLVSKPTEDFVQIKMAATRLAQDKELKEKLANAASPEEQKKLLMKLIIGAVIFIFFFVIVIVLLLAGKTEEIHHIVNSP